MQTPSSPKGTRDFYPEDMAVREFIFSSWEKTCRRHGFEKYDGPMFEHLELYTQKSGDEIEKQLYTFEDKAGRRMALRPEMTPTLARMVASRGGAQKLPVRWYSIPTLFRYERMQKGRLREFSQLNMDILGIADVSADAELIAAVIATMTDLGLSSGDFSVRISSRTLLEELFVAAGVARDNLIALYAILDKHNKIADQEFGVALAELLGTEMSGRIGALLGMTALDEIDRHSPGLASIARMRELFDLLALYGCGEFAQFDIGIVRGLAYYTGIVFEVFDKQQSLRAVAGGGRYDRLVSLYGGPDTPAVGFAAGDVVLAELLKAKGIAPPSIPRSEVFVVSFEREQPGKAIAMAQLLRNAGISCEFALKPLAVGKQMKLANDCSARLVVFAGGDEAKSGLVRIKNMVSGEEQTESESNLVSAVQTKLGARGTC